MAGLDIMSWWRGDSGGGPVDMGFVPGDEAGGWGSAASSLGDQAAGYLETAKNAALPALAQSAALGLLDGFMDDAPGKGEFFNYQPPGTDTKTGQATPRSFSITPLGWGAIAGLGVLVYLTTR